MCRKVEKKKWFYLFVHVCKCAYKLTKKDAKTFTIDDDNDDDEHIRTTDLTVIAQCIHVNDLHILQN